MKKTSEEFGQGKIPNSLIVPISEIPRDLAKLAQLFVRLQQERHRADYDSQASFSLAGVSDLLAETKAALELWPALETHPAAELYLLAMLFQPLGR